MIGDAAALRNAVTDELEQVPGKVASALVADGPRDLVLVLDNLHEITGLAVHESLLRLVQRPPRGLRLSSRPAGTRRGRSTSCAWPGC